MSAALRRLAGEAPGSVALLAGGRAITRGELDRAADRLAVALARAGVGAGDRVAWMMRNRPEVFVLAVATQRLGAVAVPLSYRAAPPEIARMLRFAGARAVVADEESRTAVGEVWRGELVDPSAMWAGGPVGDRAAPPDVVGDRLGAGATMVFTSGTTGAPKAAVRTRGDAGLARRIAEAFGFGPTTRFLVAGPLYHSGPWTCALMTLTLGGVVGTMPSFAAVEWLRFAATHAFDAAFLTPTQLRRLVEAAEAGAPAPPLANVVVSGEHFAPELKRRAVAAFGPAFGECYGCTELGPLTWMPRAELAARPGSCGRPFPGVQVRAFDPVDGRPLADGETGVLRARTPMAFDGYLVEPGASPDRAGEGWATVGDLGFVDGDGYVAIVGRSDDMIITGGVNVFPADVEAVLVHHPAVRECAVFGVPDDRWGQAVWAAVVADGPLSSDDVRTWLRGRIADDRRPRCVVVVDELPRTGTDKLARRELTRRYAVAVATT